MLWQGIARTFHISIGTASFVVALGMILFALIYDKSQIHIGTVLYQIVYSTCVDLFANCHIYRTYKLSLIHISYAKEEPVPLTRKENGILEYLLINIGRPVSQEELIEHVWDATADSFSGAIRVHMSSLRKKLKAKLGYDPILNKVGAVSYTHLDVYKRQL